MPWKGGYYSRLDIDYPACFQGVRDIFDIIGAVSVMRRCRRKVTQNLNESVHAKLWRKALKFKHHSKERYIFSCIQVVMEHNFGHEKGSLLNCLDAMSKPAQRMLRYKNTESIRVASRKHHVVPGGARTKNRKKTSCRNSSYEAGMDL